MISKIEKKILSGEQISLAQAHELANSCSDDVFRAELCQLADAVRRHYHGNKISLCSIINAKMGGCSENCRFCAQASAHDTGIDRYSVVDLDETLAQAKLNQSYGVSRFSLVSAGRNPTNSLLNSLKPHFNSLRQQTSLDICASMGLLTEERAKLLVELGVSRYHCNLESCREFFPQICTSHSWQDKVKTIGIAQKAGLQVCSGGIIGLGESLIQRLQLAFELRDLNIFSIPINILNPIAGTPLGSLPMLSLAEVEIAFALFRLINPMAVIRSAGGRNLLGENQKKIYLAGANGAIVGDYLTTAGEGLAHDSALFQQLGFNLGDSNE